MKKLSHWLTYEIGDIATTFSGGTPNRSKAEYFSGSIPWIKSGELNAGWVSTTEECITEEALIYSSAKLVPPGTTLLALYGATAGVVGRTRISAAINQAILAIVPDQSTLADDYLSYLLRDLAASLLKMVQGAQPNLNAGIVRSAKVELPPLPEQRKIAEILGKWDEALEKLDALISAKERRKKALMQKLLTGTVRVKGFTEPWKTAQLCDLAENVADQNRGRMGTQSLYGVTKAAGVVPMREHVKGESFARCKRVETDWFAYNPMRINIGSIARYQGSVPVMVSGDYVVFRCNEERLLPAYLDHLRKSWMWESFVTRGGNGSVRIRIYFSDLGEFRFRRPPVEEQRVIAEILDTCDEELRLLRAERDALDQQKRGLMQRLLTGKVRVTL
jgi:type I restriction enzyme S subunit